MKKQLITLTVLLLTAATTVNAQKRRSENPKQIVKTNPIALIFGVYNVGYERATKENQSLVANIGFFNFDRSGIKASGFGAGVDYRFYFQNKDAFEGWFAGPTVNYGTYDFDNNNSLDLKANVFSFGGLGGYQWNWNNFMLDLFAGPVFNSVSGDADEFNLRSNGIGLTAGFNLGFAF